MGGTKDLAAKMGILDNSLCRYPILQTGMGGVARASLAAAVSDAVGYGCLGMVREPP